MKEESDLSNLVEKIEKYDVIEILVNEKQELFFDDIIDPVYIKMHFERVVNTSKDFDNVKLIGYQGKKIRVLIAEVFVSN